MDATTGEDKPSDEELAARVADGWPRACPAFNQLYDRHARLLLAYLCARAGRDQGEVLHQEVWMRVWARLPDHHREGDFRGWIFRVARNLHIDQMRKRRPEPLGEAEARVPDGRSESPDGRLLKREYSALFEKCLEALDRDTEALVRARMQGETYEEIGARLGVLVATLHTRFHKAKARLRTCLGNNPS